MKEKKTVAFIFARGGSKGLPGKNIKVFQGKPLIAHSIEYALNHDNIHDVIVSTDCEQIAQIAKEYGARVPFLRPKELAQDKTAEMFAWRHAVDFYRHNIGEFDYFLSLPTVSPLRVARDFDEVLKKLNRSEVDFVFSTVESDANPYFNLVEENDGFFSLSKSQGMAYQRQAAKKVFQIIPMYYACQPHKVFEHETVLSGSNDIVVIDKARAIDIDTLDDFHYLEYMSSKGNI